MEASKIKAYVLCREHINYFSNAKKELKYNKLSQMKNCNPYEISHTLKYYSGLKSFKNEISQEDCDKYIMLFEEVKEKINKSILRHWLEDNNKTIDELKSILEAYEKHLRFFYESYGYLKSHTKILDSFSDKFITDYELNLLYEYGDVESLLYKSEFIDSNYFENIRKIRSKFDLDNGGKVILSERDSFKKKMKILECSDITYIQTSFTFIARRNHHYGYLSYDYNDALTFIKGIERLREIVNSY